MAATLWLKDGKLVVDADGDPIICSDCPCDHCSAAATLTIVLSGIASCGCVDQGGLQSAKIDALTINGSHTVTMTAPGVWQVVGVGTETEHHYTAPSDPHTPCAPADEDGTWTQAFTIDVTCTGGIYSVSISWPVAHIFSTTAFTGSGTLGAAISNTISCEGISTGIGGGTATISV